MMVKVCNKSLDERFYNFLTVLEKNLFVVFSDLITLSNEINYFQLRKHLEMILVYEDIIIKAKDVIDEFDELEQKYDCIFVDLAQKYKDIEILKNNCLTFYEKRIMEERCMIASHIFPLCSEDDNYDSLEDEAVVAIYNMFENNNFELFDTFRNELKEKIISILKDFSGINIDDEVYLYLKAYCRYASIDSKEKTRNLRIALEKEELTKPGSEPIITPVQKPLNLWQRIRKKFEGR